MRHALALPAFRRLAGTYALNQIADWLAAIALTVLVYDRTGTVLGTTALFLAAKFLPSALIPALAVRAERLPVRRCLAGLYVLEAGIFAVLALGANAVPIAVVCLLAFVEGTVAATARAITRGTTALVLEPRGRLREGNAILNFVFAASNVGGPAGAALLVELVGAGTVLAVAGAVFALMIPVIGSARGLPAASTDETPWYRRLRDGLSYVRDRPAARRLLAAESVLFVLFYAAAPIEVALAEESLDAGPSGYGALLTAWGAGAVLGSMVFARVRHRSMLLLAVLSTLAVGGGYLGLGLAPGLATACAAAVLGGLGNGIQWVAVVTAIQEAVTRNMQARVAGVTEAVATATPGLGFLLGGGLATALSPRLAFVVAGSCIVALTLAGVAVSARRDRPETGGIEPALAGRQPA